MVKEKIHFKITLNGTYWDKRPHFKILVDDQECLDAYITKPSGQNEDFEFDCEVEEDMSHTLRIRFDNKTVEDTVTDSADIESCKILKDMLLNLVAIEVDDIDLGGISQMFSTYYYDEPQNYPEKGSTELACCVNFGFNGTYELGFTSPFYMWLLEKI